MKSPITITAVITTYNRAAMVGRAIDSVLAQTRPVDELIVVDDGSSDHTRKMVERYGTRVRYIFQKNRGLACARNTGTEEARSEWVAFLDDDDEWLPDKTEKQISAVLAQEDAVLCYSGIKIRFSDGTTREVMAPAADKLWPGLRLRNRFAPSTILARRDILLSSGGFRSGLRGAEDWELSARLAAQYRFVAVSDPLINFHTYGESLSKKTDVMLVSELSITDSLLVGLQGPARYLWRLRVLSAIFYRAAVAARATTGSGFGYLLRSLFYWPSPMTYPERYKTLAAEIRDRFATNR